MKIVNKKETSLLLGGDILILVLSLWLTLLLRTGQKPSTSSFVEHLLPFGIIFVIWLFIFFIVGLYEKHTTLFKSHLPTRIFNTQIFNSFLAVVFFYFVPYFGIKPKITLFIYIAISSALLLSWRIYGQKVFGLKVREKAMILGRGEEMDLLLREVNNNIRYGLEFVSSFDLDKLGDIDFEKEIISQIDRRDISVIVLDLQNDLLKKNRSALYNLLFSKIHFVNISLLYEDIFDRIPLSLISYDWFLENISLSTGIIYDLFKRLIDLTFSFTLGLFSLIFYPFICLAIKLEDHGPIFIIQKRIGKNNKLIKIIKFRTMSFNDNEEKNPKINENLSEQRVNKITKVGSFLRKSRLDEIPQLWNVWKGDLSLIGPRPELPALAEIYEKEIPYYNIRHLITPGLSGWAQLYHENHPHQGANIFETKNKLSYDLFYVKNKSLLLDIKITLKTVKIILSRSGR